jgi:predicted RNase H-like HicB family nuclease
VTLDHAAAEERERARRGLRESVRFVGFVPGCPGAHTQAESLDELNANLREVLAMLLEDGEPHIEAEFIGTQLVQVG